jgi:biotin synthase
VTATALHPGRLTEADILGWLREEDEARLEDLWHAADAVRAEYVGDEVHLRGLVEISNHCVRRCAYCGISSLLPALRRYRMSEEETLACAHRACRLGYGTVVMQSGEDYGIMREWLCRIIRRIKAETPLAVTLSLGERPAEDLAAWREAGADRYLLRFETSDRALYDLLHPPRDGHPSDRLAILRRLQEMGYEIGGGVMVGIPGQTYESLANDICIFRRMDMDMVGIGPYIPHPASPLGAGEVRPPDARERQVPNSELMTCKVVALTRLVCPEANIPSTTALATIDPLAGRKLGLARGANVVMPNVTPPACRALYEIYPGKACCAETAEACGVSLEEQIRAMGRRVGTGSGSRRRQARGQAPIQEVRHGAREAASHGRGRRRGLRGHDPARP